MKLFLIKLYYIMREGLLNPGAITDVKVIFEGGKKIVAIFQNGFRKK